MMDEARSQLNSATHHRRKRKLLPCQLLGKSSLIYHYLKNHRALSQLDSATRHSRKRKRKSVANADDIGINKLPDEMLVAIISCMSLKDAGKTSVLSRRWRYLWTFKSGSLDFDARPTPNGPVMESKKFKAWVNNVLNLHQSSCIDSFTIRFGFGSQSVRSDDIDSWIYFAMRKEVKRFELKLWYDSRYKFPNMERLLTRFHEVKSTFGSIRSLKLDEVNIEDGVVQFLLASCPCLEELCVRRSSRTKNLKVVDPLPNLKFLEISDCFYIQSLEISVVNLVSFTYDGRLISLPFKKVPNLSELTLGGELCESFIYEPSKHSTYSVQLVKLSLDLHFSFVINGPQRFAPRDLYQLYSLKQLELSTVSQVGLSLFFFTSLIKASPLLHEFRIEIDYMSGIVDGKWYESIYYIPFPIVTQTRKATKPYHKNLKVVEMAGFVGCLSEREFLLGLSEIAPSLEKVVINTSCYFDEEPLYWGRKRTVGEEPKFGDEPCDPGANTRIEARERAKYLESKFPPQIKLVID